MAFTKITNAELGQVGVMRLPNQPQISAEDLKKAFDSPTKELVAPKFNNLVETELPATTAASNIGAASPPGRTASGNTVQDVVNKISDDLATLETNAGQAIADAHTHSNKAVIDKFDDTGTGLTYDGNPVGAVTSVNNKTGAVSLTASDVGALPSTTSIPTKTSDLTNDSNFVADASYVHTDNNYDATAKGIVDGATAAINAKSTVSWNQIDTTGTKIAEITINGVKTDVKATGGGSADAYKTIKVGTTTLTASGADTIEFVADDNIILTPDATTTPKQIKIKSTGGGTGSASWGGISGTLSNQTDLQNALDAKANTASLATVATTGAYADLTGQPTIPTKVSDLTNDSGYQTASDVSTAISGKEDKTALKDLAYIAKDGVGSTKVLQGDGTWVTPSTGGHTMTPTPSSSVDEDDVNTAIQAALLEGGENDDVVSAYGVGVWSNTDTNILLSEVNQNDTEMGTWEDESTWQTGSRVGWLFHKALFKALDVNSGIDIEPVFEMQSGSNDAISCLMYRIDDEIYQSTTPVSNPKEEGLYESNGQTPPTYTLTNDETIVSGKTYYVGVGAGAIKFNAPIPTTNVQVGFKLTKLRTNVFRSIVRSS